MSETAKIIELKLSKSELDLLLRAVKEKNLIEKLEKLRPLTDLDNSVFIIKVTIEEAEALLDALTYALTDIGSDEASEPNEIGLKIERLIDQLSSYIY